ncbi:androgen-induced gene 1 protein-like [Pollicipes pollicipes]|uniref:androgen-induced gene 1 protein-like n=1 Tax=Pollicipes pollicipes TaxID=41117 RepID=UPI00188493D2|nr:androgen-induced gene 1 protein-like [Pollicipes pollicipes]
MSLLLHLVGVAVFGACTYYDTYYVLENAGPHQDNPLVKELFNSRPQWGGRWKFLTVWGLTVQLIYYVIAAMNDLLGSSTFVRRDGTRLQRLRDLFFTALALPVALVVCLMFWGLYAIHRDLVFPEVMDLFYPWWLNHGVHTMPLLLGLLEVLTVRHHYASNWVSVALLATFLVTYLAWTMYLALVAEIWVYGVLRVLSWPLRFLFMAGNLLVALGLFALGKRMDAVVWGKEKAAAAAKEGGGKKRR